MSVTINELLSKNRTLIKKTNAGVVLGYESNTERIIALKINTDGTLPFSTTKTTPRRFYGIKTISAYAVDKNLIDITTSKNTEILNILLTGNGYGCFSLYVDNVKIASLRNSYFERDVFYSTPFLLRGGQNLKIAVKNETINDETNTYECFVFYNEV